MNAINPMIVMASTTDISVNGPALLVGFSWSVFCSTGFGASGAFGSIGSNISVSSEAINVW